MFSYDFNELYLYSGVWLVMSIGLTLKI